MSFLTLVLTCILRVVSSYDDFHYPVEEREEMASVLVGMPSLVSVNASFCILHLGGETQTVTTGDVAFSKWHVLGLMPAMSTPAVAIEQNFMRWGVQVIVFTDRSPQVLRKSVGNLAGIKQPYFDFTSKDPAYFKTVADSVEDYPALLAANQTTDGEPDYASLASTLAPVRDMVEISNAADVVKFVVTHNGRVKCASYHDHKMNGITDFDDLHAPPPNEQTIVFDPANHSSYWPHRFNNSKVGLVGGHLRIANVGSFSESVNKGFELMAFSPVKKTVGDGNGLVTCEFDGPFNDSYVAGCSAGCKKLETLAAAKRVCAVTADCNGVTLKSNRYELRSANTTDVSKTGETSWVLKNGDTCTTTCNFTGPFTETFVAGCSQGCRSYSSFSEAEQGCAAATDCNGITLRSTGKYELRASTTTSQSKTGETSWLLVNGDDCHDAPSPSPSPGPSPKPMPRLPNINYNPGVYVRFREESGESFGNFQYWYVSNETHEQVTSEEFYTELSAYEDFYSSALSEGMHIDLPETDKRQADMARSVLLSSWGNYVGDQSNYGNGATYWSIAREDNGSLPLNILSVEEANLEWGLCSVSLPHIQFYHENYIRPDGSINYYSWGPYHDSYGDAGRLASLFVKASQLCPDKDWIDHNTPFVERLARWMLEKRQNASSSELPTYQKGLVVGVPEHDWHATKDKYFYSNNLVLLRGMEEFGSFLLQDTSRNTTLGNMLLTDTIGYRSDIFESLKLCTIFSDGSPFFLPPIAETNFTPYERMTYGSWKSNRYPEYSNFRFYPEMLLADVMPRDLESVLLQWHNHRGGRIGGASRWGNWLDDMPVAGWGFGALTNNQTNNFLGLLYGHAATYQSRGTFHSTEQLSFQGEGWYRHFLHWPNPAPNATWEPHSGLQYYGSENDVSFCIVSQVIIARMTRWQLVFEDFYRPQHEKNMKSAIWLARAAPKRWFSTGSGFNVTNAPTRFGRLTYQVVLSESHAAYQVHPPASTPETVEWKLRWPFEIGEVSCEGCTVLQVEKDGFATVSSHNSGRFVAQVERKKLNVLV